MAEPAVRLVAEGLHFPEGPVPEPDGSVLVSEMAVGRITRVLPDGRKETVATPGGGPNGMCRLPSGDLVVCQNGGASWGEGPWPMNVPGALRVFRPLGPPSEALVPQLQRVDRTGETKTLATHFLAVDGQRRALVRPSDICADADGGFYLTDGGTTEGRQRTLTGLLYGDSNGDLREILYPLEMPNGVALSPSGDRLYVAETRTRRVWCCGLAGPGILNGIRALGTVPSGGPLNMGGADGLCVDGAGNVIVATLGSGGITVLDDRGALLSSWPMDDPLTTNAAMSVDGLSVFVTLASTGRLMNLKSWVK
jgi:gluconolactonase